MGAETGRAHAIQHTASLAGRSAGARDFEAGRLELLNDNMDVGAPVLAGKYKGVDQAYDKLLGKLSGHHFDGISPELRGNLVDYYKDRKAPRSRPNNKENTVWMKQIEQLDQLPAATP